MAMIKCMECGKLISDKSNVCINCGCPTKVSIENKTDINYICIINGKPIDFSDIYDEIIQLTKEERIGKILNLISKKSSLEMKDSMELYKVIQKGDGLPNSYNGKEAKCDTNNLLPKCPKCGSTSITAGQRGYKLLTGFLGSNKTVNRCANCGHQWKPGN